ncbi:unnamed protein product [Choristocarpus tenellus]
MKRTTPRLWWWVPFLANLFLLNTIEHIICLNWGSLEGRTIYSVCFSFFRPRTFNAINLTEVDGGFVLSTFEQGLGAKKGIRIRNLTLLPCYRHAVEFSPSACECSHRYILI